MPAQHILRDLFVADAAQARRGIGEAFLDQIRMQADGLEDLGTTIGIDGSNTDFRHDLEQTLLGSFDIVFDHLLLGHGFVSHFAALHRFTRSVQRQIRINRRGPIADQRGKVVCLARLTALADQAGAHP